MLVQEELINELNRESRKLLGDNLMIDYNPELSFYERLKCLQHNRIRFALAFPKHFRFIDVYSYSPCIKPELRKLDDDSSSREAILSLIKEGQSEFEVNKNNISRGFPM